MPRTAAVSSWLHCLCTGEVRVASTTPALHRLATVAERRSLRRIPVLRSLSPRELEDVQQRMIYRSYQAGDVIWRTRGPLHFSGFVQSGEIELEIRVDG